MTSKIIFVDTFYHFGFCEEKSKTPKNYSEIIESSGKRGRGSCQVFLREKNSDEEIKLTREMVKKYQMELFVHADFRYNLFGASKYKNDPKFSSKLKFTCSCLTSDLDLSVGLGGSGVVVHPNSCHDEKGYFTCSMVIEHLLTKPSSKSKIISKLLGITIPELIQKRKLLLENSAHEGEKRGWNLKELNRMIQGIKPELRSQIGICIDTAHAFGAGVYDFGKVEDVERFYKEFEEEIGLEYLKLFHLNDSKVEFGSRMDRHENLGNGYIFSESGRKEGLKEFLLQARRRGIPIICEPPGNEDIDWELVCKITEGTDFPLIEVY